MSLHRVHTRLVSERHSAVPPPVPSPLEQRVAKLESAVHAVLYRLDDEHAKRTRVARVAYLFGGVFAGAAAEALRGAIESSAGAEHVIRVLFGG